MLVEVMDFYPIVCCIFAAILLFVFVVILRTVYVLKKRRNNEPCDRKKPVKVMVVAGSGNPCFTNEGFIHKETPTMNSEAR